MSGRQMSEKMGRLMSGKQGGRCPKIWGGRCPNGKCHTILSQCQNKMALSVLIPFPPFIFLQISILGTEVGWTKCCAYTDGSPDWDSNWMKLEQFLHTGRESWKYQTSSKDKDNLKSENNLIFVYFEKLAVFFPKGDLELEVIKFWLRLY